MARGFVALVGLQIAFHTRWAQVGAQRFGPSLFEQDDSIYETAKGYLDEDALTVAPTNGFDEPNVLVEYSDDEYSSNSVEGPTLTDEPTLFHEAEQPSYPDVELTSEESHHVLQSLVHNVETEITDRTEAMTDEPTEYDTPQNALAVKLMSVGEAELKKWLEQSDTNVTMTSGLADTMLRGIERSASPSCRSGRKGGKSKDENCEAVLPLNLNYGCWCHADNADIFKGTGKHVDEFDRACKMYKQCLRCVRHDSHEAGEVCDPGTQSYTTENTRSKDGIHAECTANNDNNCAVNTCCCEVDYVRTVLKLFIIDGVKLQKRLYHKHRFSQQKECQGVGPDTHAKDCCGEYPKRRMYNTHTKSCCHNTSVFDPYMHVCCDDGESAVRLSECGNPNRTRKKRRAEMKRATHSSLGFFNM